MGGAIAGFLFQLAPGGGLGRFARAVVADQPRGQFEAVALQRHAILFDQDDMAPVRCVVDGQDHRGMNAARARYIFPRPLLPHGDETTFPSRLDGGVGGGAGHENLFQISISRSGSSFGFSSRFGTCSARTTPMRFTASAMPAPGSPAAMRSTSEIGRAHV